MTKNSDIRLPEAFKPVAEWLVFITDYIRKYIPRRWKWVVVICVALYASLNITCNAFLEKAAAKNSPYRSLCSCSLYQSDEWIGLEYIREKHPEFVADLKAWEDMHDERNDRTTALLLRKKMDAHVATLKALDNHEYRSFPSARLYVRGNLAFFYTASAILYNKQQYANEAAVIFAQIKDQLRNTTNEMDTKWHADAEVLYKSKIFRIHLFAYLATNAQSTDEKLQYLDAIAALSSELGGLKRLKEDGLIKNGKTVSNLTALGLLQD